MSQDAVRHRLEARFGAGWPAVLEVPDRWLGYLDVLDQELSSIDPHYQLAQVKMKYGGLRFYLEHPTTLPCCAVWDEANPLLEHADEAAEREWEERVEAHCQGAEHLEAERARSIASQEMDALVNAAETSSRDW